MGRPITHGMSKTGTFSSWAAMKTRCSNPNNSRYKIYGGKGIRVCKRWLTFDNFYIDMGDRPKGKSIDRIDNSKNYEPNNCRWATPKEQAINRTSTVLITFNGKTLSQADWAKRIGINVFALKRRIASGWDIEDALTLPRQPVNRSRKAKKKNCICKECGNAFVVPEYVEQRRGAVYCSKLCYQNHNATLLTFGNKTLGIQEWSKQTGISASTLRARIFNYGWTVERAISTPIR